MMNTLAEAAQKAVEVMQASGETLFNDLKKREKQEIFDAFILSTGSEEWETDGDNFDIWAIYLSEDERTEIKFGGYGNESLLSDVRSSLEDIQFVFNFKSFEGNDLEGFKRLANDQALPVQVVNLTPHEVKIVDDAGAVIKAYPATGKMVRVNTNDIQLPSVDEVPVVRVEYTDVDGLPESRPNTIYLVSVLVAQALGGSRRDVYTPDTGPKSVFRDAGGQIVGVRRLMQI
ncbi:hypothetical protein JOD82_001877 [Paenibacillus sp. 1182]|uniref:hypothetical protein n=1 Tax=Paenibacillus sp. 1182 TaxID=2806565 RepID=UPI001AEA4428|nr:hypothetical protein [Paenibacillus sp. 1182]MBP1308857.1 hypothetical protein [Paenibacillus sp. 1182]